MPVSRIHRTGSPYNAEELGDLDFEQTADVIYLAHENHVPTKLIRLSHYSWQFSAVAFGPTIGVPATLAVAATTANTDAANSGNAYFPQQASYVVTAYNEETGQESRASNAVSAVNDLGLKRNYNTISWGAVTGATGYRIYKSENTQTYGYIGTTMATSFIDDNIGPDLSEGPPVADNPFVGAGNYPGTITFHEQRAFWGRSVARPNALWASRSADYENMDVTRPGRADDALLIGLVANKVNVVNQLVSTKEGLLALTSNNIFTVQGSNEDFIAATPPPRVRPAISRGVSRLNPLTIDNVIFYETAKLSSVRTIGYDLELDGIKTDDLTVFSPHFFENQDIIDWAYSEKPGSNIWVVRGDGKLLCLTFEQEQQVWGWTLCETDGLFKGVCTITEQGEDRAYFVVQRTIGGEDRLFIERMASELWEDQVDACYLDCARTFVNDAPKQVIDRLDHLEGKTVSAFADGFVVTGLIVANGRVQLPVAASTVTVGLPFTALIETLPIAMQTRAGWNVAKPQSANKVVVRVVRTRGIEIGPDEDGMFPVKQRDEDPIGRPAALFSGDILQDLDARAGNEVVVVVRSSEPLPMQIGAIFLDPDISEDG
jgi:hypothetical protein